MFAGADHAHVRASVRHRSRGQVAGRTEVFKASILTAEPQAPEAQGQQIVRRLLVFEQLEGGCGEGILGCDVNFGDLRGGGLGRRGNFGVVEAGGTHSVTLDVGCRHVASNLSHYCEIGGYAGNNKNTAGSPLRAARPLL